MYRLTGAIVVTLTILTLSMSSAAIELDLADTENRKDVV